MIILLIVVFTSLVLYEVPGLVRKRQIPELVTYCFFMLFAFVCSLLLSLGIDLPSPSIVIKYIIKDLLHLNYR